MNHFIILRKFHGSLVKSKVRKIPNDVWVSGPGQTEPTC